MPITLTLERTTEGLFLPSELITGWQQIEAVRHSDHVVLRAKSNSAVNQREQVLSALRQANLVAEPNWEAPPPVSAQERAMIAQELSGNPPVSQLVLSEREDRGGRISD